MSILIVGERGYLGSYLSKRLLLQGTESYSEDYVINCAGLVSVELSEENPDKSYDSNVAVIQRLIKEYPRHKLINFSSYYVYDAPGVLCDEDSNTTDKYVYMRHKLLGERYTLEAGGVCFRLGKLYGHRDTQKQNRLTERLIRTEGKGVVLDDVQFNPTSIASVYEVVAHELMFNDLNGLYNLSDDGTVSHYEYGKYVLNRLGITTPPEHVKKNPKMFHNYGSFAMDISKIKKAVSINKWTTMVDRYIGSLEGLHA